MNRNLKRIENCINGYQDVFKEYYLYNSLIISNVEKSKITLKLRCKMQVLCIHRERKIRLALYKMLALRNILNKRGYLSIC